jgi:hypothetical protein
VTFSRAVRLALIAVLAICGPVSAQTRASASPFANWVAVIAAGDFRAHSGAPTQVFDNGRRDLTKALVSLGFSPDNIAQFSAWPDLSREPGVLNVVPSAGFSRELQRLTKKSPGGCLVYLTSHGSEEGILYGSVITTPHALKTILDGTCGARPTVAIVSACFSGVFAPVLAADNRVVMTAARPDRASFGCSEDEVYTFFDACILQSLPASATFDILAEKARICVDAREKELGVGPPSEPQTVIGPQIRTLLPALKLTLRPPPPASRAARPAR